ncbi:MAG: DUF3122 domain-containing protein [Cyanobacteria bacterium P01_A01_bin.123]
MKRLLSFLAIARKLTRQSASLISAAVSTILHITMQPRLCKTLAKLLVILGLTLLLIVGWSTPVALAKVKLLEDADQWVYQAQHVLPDTDGNLWQVTVLKQMEGRRRGVDLRLITQSQTIHLDATQPLILNLVLDKQLSAPNVTRQFFIGVLPEPIGCQYDIQALLPELKNERSLQLAIPMQAGSPATLIISSEVLEQWMTVGTCEYLICNT